MTRLERAGTMADGGEKLLVAMVAGFSETRAVDWLRVKFPSFDSSHGEPLDCAATKNERDYFADARLLGFVTRMPEDGTTGTAGTNGTTGTNGTDATSATTGTDATSATSGTRHGRHTVAEVPAVPDVPSPALRIATLVDRILAAKKADPAADTSALESEIDALVYQLYGLTEEEIKVVEGRDKAAQEAAVTAAAAPAPSRKRSRAAKQAEADEEEDEVLE